MAISGTTTPAQMESYYKGSVVNAAEFLRNIMFLDLSKQYEFK